MSALGLASCAYPTVPVHVQPARVTVLQGESVTVTLRTGPPACLPQEEEPEPVRCQDVAGHVFDYTVDALPPGVTYGADTSLAGPATPGVTRLTFRVGAETAPGEHYRVVLQAVLAGRVVGRAELPFRVLAPGPTPPVAAARAIAARGSSSVAALADGSVRAWGRNSEGQLGLGDLAPRHVPSRVEPLDDIVAVSTGSRHVLALDANGQVWAWGGNDHGQLGNGVKTETLAETGLPVAVQGLHDVAAIAAGDLHSLALTNDGTVWAWGDGAEHKLGSLGIADRVLPAPVTGLPPARAIAAGDHYSLAVGGDGSVWIWGVAALGVFGSDNTPIPIQVPGLRDIHTIVTERGSALAVDGDGRVWAWGSNFFGRLGLGDAPDPVMPVRVEGLPEVISVALGGIHGMALAVDGTAWDWGGGVLGDGRFGGPPGVVPGLSGVRAVAVGDDHFLALLECGQIWSWGHNGFGQLGDGSAEEPATPVLVDGIGGDSDCAEVVLRVSLAGGIGAVADVVAADAGELEWNGVDSFAVFERGAPVELTARALASFAEGLRFTFDGWAGDCQGTDPQTSVLLDRGKRCVARYRDDSPAPALLTVDSGSGGVVTSSSDGIWGSRAIDCGTTCQAIFRVGTVVDLAAAPAAGFAFGRWSADCEGTAPQTSVLVSGPRHCVAEFAPHPLTVSVSGGGRVTSEPPGLDCGAACSFAPGVGEVRLTATPDLGFAFDSWGGDCTGTAGEAVVAMDAGKSCHATFRRIPGFFLLSTVVEGEGSLTSAPDGINCPGTCLALYPAGTAVDLTAHETPRSLLSFWLDDCAAPGPATNRVVMDADKQCRARFVGQPAYPVAAITYAPVPHVGRVVRFDGTASHVFDPVTGTSDPRLLSFSWDFDADGAFEASGSRAGAAVAQHAFQTAGDHAALLRVVGGPFDTSDVSVETVTVQEAVAPLFGLTVAKSGTGLGTLATDPPGLFRCGSGCDTAGLLLEAGTLVTLTAEPSGDSTFSGWSGAGCTAAGPTVQVTMSEVRSCTATFDAAPAGPFTLTVVVAEPAAAFVSIIGVQPASNAILCRVSGGPTCTQSFPADSVVVVRPSDSSIELGLFPIWTGCDAVGTLFACTVTLTGNRTVTASFGP